MPLPKRRSSSSSSTTRTPSGRALLPPPITMGPGTGDTRPPAPPRTPGRRDRDRPRRCLHLPDRIWVEGSLDPGPRAGYRLQRVGVHDLLGRPPYLREVLLDWVVRHGVGGLPVDHRLVHPAAVEVGADRPLEVVDEGVRVLGRLGPVKVAVLVRYVAVERGDRRGDYLAMVILPSRGPIAWC